MTYLKSRTAFWPELILMLLMQLKLAEARALAEAVAQALPPKPDGGAPPAEAEQPTRQVRIVPSPRRRHPAAIPSAQGRQQPEALEAELRARPLATERLQARPLHAARLPLAASAGEARLPGTASQPAARAETTPSGQEILSDLRPRSALQRPMAPPPPPPRPLSWSYAGSADTLSDGDAGQPAAATPASQSDSSGGPTNQESASPPTARATAARVLPPAPPPLALRATAAISRQTGGQILASQGSGQAARSPAAAAPRELNPAQADGEAGLAANSPLPVAAATQPPQPSPAGPIVIIPIPMVPPSTGTGAALEAAGAATGQRPGGTQADGTSPQGLRMIILSAAVPGAGEPPHLQLPAGVALSQALRQQLPASAGAASTGMAAAGPLASAGRAIVIRLGDGAAADITAAVNAARRIGASGSGTLPGEAQSHLLALGNREELVRLGGEGDAARPAGGSMVGTMAVDGGRLFWIGTTGAQSGAHSAGPGQVGGDPTGPDSLSDTIVVWFTPGDGSTAGLGAVGDWISDLTALSEEIDRITSAGPGDPDRPAGDGSGSRLFTAIHDTMAELARGSGLFVQIDGLNDLSDLGVSAVGDPFV